MEVRTVGRRIGLALVICGLATARASAQAWNYPSMHHPVIMERQFNFAVASGGDAGTSVFAQWREGLSPTLEIDFEAGFADPDDRGAAGRFFLGAGFALPVFTAQPNLPINFHLTGGVYPSFGDEITIVRIPFGVSLGRRLPLENARYITPYVHPRVSLDFCNGDVCDDSDININFDLGGDFELNPQLALRFSILVGDNTAFGFSLGWKPNVLARLVR